MAMMYAVMKRTAAFGTMVIIVPMQRIMKRLRRSTGIRIEDLFWEWRRRRALLRCVAISPGQEGCRI